MMTDDAGTRTMSATYTPYGSDAYYAGVTDTKYKFTGQEKDSGSGLYYYGARYYDPELGRFVQPDTYLDSLNRYAYCRNNPVNYTDPTGNIPWWAQALIYTGLAYLKGVESSGSWNPGDWSNDDWSYALTLGTGILTLGFSTVTGIFADAGPVHYSPGEEEQQQEQQDNLIDSLNQLDSALNEANYYYDLYYQDPYERGGGSDSIRIAEAGVSDVGTNWWEFIDNDGIPGYTKMGYAVDAWKDKNYLSATSWWLSGAMDQFAFVGGGYLGAKSIHWISMAAFSDKLNVINNFFEGQQPNIITNKFGDKILMTSDKKIRMDFLNSHGDLPHMHFEVLKNNRWIDAFDIHRFYPK